MAAVAAPGDGFVPVNDAWTGVNLHHEYKGATGSVTRAGNGWKIHYEFTGNCGQALADGTLEIDFARESQVTLFNEIPVWGRPMEFLLTVEAHAEAAGTEFLLGFRGGKPLVFNSFGKLRPPVPGSTRIYQTLSMPGPCNALGWKASEKGTPG